MKSLKIESSIYDIDNAIKQMKLNGVKMIIVDSIAHDPRRDGGLILSVRVTNIDSIADAVQYQKSIDQYHALAGY